jgi:TrmH family RNA methyltransferase
MKIEAPIQSPNNDRAKQWASLLERKGRDKLGQYIIEGFHLIEEAIAANAIVRTIVFSAEKGLPDGLWQAAMEAGIESTDWVPVSEAVMAKCCVTETPQGVFAVLDKPAEDGGSRLLSSGCDLVVAVDGVQDPGNLGTIIRSADAVGAAGVALGRGTVDLYNPKTIRATQGSFFHLPVVLCDLQSVLPAARAAGAQLLITSLNAAESCYEADLRKPTWIVVGNEGSGVSPQVMALADRQVVIPMRGGAESLNVAMAATVLLFEAQRQRLSK